MGTTGFVGDDVTMASSSHKNGNTNRSGRTPRSSMVASSLASPSIVDTVFDNDSPDFINYPGLKSKDAPPESPILAPPPGRVPLPWDDWTHGPFFRQSLVDHMTRRPRLTHAEVPTGTPETPPDALSPWISTSADFSWAVWEAARRLGQLGESSIEIALVALAPGETASKNPATGANGIEAPTSDSEPPLLLSYAATTPSGGSGEVTLEPLNVLRDYQRYGTGTGDHGRMTNSEKEYVATAIFASASSREVLFLGRIFARSVVANLEFTPSTLPIALPAHFFNRSPGPNGEDWLNQLVWDPDRDDFATACRKIKSSETHQWRRGKHQEPGWGTNNSESQTPSQTLSRGATSDQSRSVTPTPNNVRHPAQNGYAKVQTTTQSAAEDTLPSKPERPQGYSGWGETSRG
ncbi:uncharacterized protein EHS24_006775 [Apiotrichum porosum]|uniref:Uncharacterized protein n=1 Tax=Apiotrichum porosum TaxID=105984 RepID=A0A427XW50_9TREE|nr:uncharacterized protein EHS24_006775 [Apiotrichum porosum]RSH83118.1 hypothetical protein EHS24_006775 [Apiotrichum porosum]